jgi:hypothetical protein
MSGDAHVPEHADHGEEHTEEDRHLEGDHDVGRDREDRLAPVTSGQSMAVKIVKANPVASP